LEVRFATKQDNLNLTAVRSVTGTTTKPIHMVNYKIHLTMEEDWDSVWYKDEGGRDKSMEVFASMYDKDGQIKTGEQIPLLPVLCYQTEGRLPDTVANQDILRTLGSNKIVLDKDTGKARIRFRVEDVSKNHQGQDFVLKIAPEPKSRGFKDIGPAYTPAVNVRSKRNKRSRNMGKGDLKDSVARGSPAASRPRLAYASDPSIPRREAVLESQDPIRLREAMKSVISWADEVVNGLYPLQWQILGYPQHPDGTPDYTRPYHNMPNPNGPIARILSMYSDHVRDSLRVLLNAVEHTNGSADEYGISAQLPREPTDPYSIMGAPIGVLHPASRAPMQPSLAPPEVTGQTMGGSVLPSDTLRTGLHPSLASEAFRSQSDSAISYHARAQMSQLQMMAPTQFTFHGESHGKHAAGAASLGSDDYVRIATLQDMSGPTALPSQRAQLEEESRESEVEYVLVKQYKALRTGERLGFPAYSADKEILGFYRESVGKVGVGQFIAISQHRNDFGPLEILQATEILEEAIAKKSRAVHSLKDWGTIANLLDHALVYDWSKDISGSSGPSSTAPS
jgi:hypothetical protein